MEKVILVYFSMQECTTSWKTCLGESACKHFARENRLSNIILPTSYACVFFFHVEMTKMADLPAKKRKAEEKKKCFRWTDVMHLSLIEAWTKCKVPCEYNNIDFDADNTSHHNIRSKKSAM